MPSIQDLPPVAAPTQTQTQAQPHTQPQHKQLYILDCGLSSPNYPHGRIVSTALSGSSSETRNIITDMTTLPDGLAIDHARCHMYWTNMGSGFASNSGSIERANLDGSERCVVVPQGVLGVWTPKQLVFVSEGGRDWLYWCDREGMKVMRAALGELPVEPQVLLSTGDPAQGDGDDRRNWCVGIAVDALRGWVYWSQKGPSKGNTGRILRASISAPCTTVECLFDGLPEPIDLDIDEENEILYWTDRGDPPRGNTLNRAFVGGEKPGEVEVLARRFHETIGLALDKDAKKAYVSDLAGGVYEVDLVSRKKKVLFPELGDLTGIALV